MSNQCSNLLSYRSFNLFPPFHTPLKPYSTTLHPVFPFHGNLIQINRRSGNRKSSLPPPVSAQSSSDVVLVATTEHHDGSLIFQFGDASEGVKNDEVEKEIESKVELESNVVKVLDRDQERGVVEKRVEGEYGSDTSRLTEVADEIPNADIDSDIFEIKTNVTSNLRDYPAESNARLSLISREEVLLSQIDAKMNESLEDVERTLDKTEFTAQLDEDESLNPTISLYDNSPHIDKTADAKGTLSENGDDETDDQLVFFKPESIQASDIEVIDVKQSYAEDKSHEVETDDVSKSDTENIMPPASIDISDVELMDTGNEDVNEEMQDMNINGVTLIDLMPPGAAVDVMESSSTEGMDVKDQAMENELQEVSSNRKDENDVAYVMHVEEADPIPDIELDDTVVQNPDDVILQTNNETEDTSVSVKLETMQVELMDLTQTDELHKVEPEDTTMSDTLPPTILNISDMEEDMNINEGTFIEEMPPSDPSGAEPSLDEVSKVQLADVKLEAAMEVLTTKGMDVCVENVMPVTFIEEAQPILKEEVSQPQLTPLEFNPTMQVSDIELMDTMGLNSDDGIVEAIDETEDPLESETMQVSHIEVMDELVRESDAKGSMRPETMHTSDIELTEDANGDMVQGLQDMNIDEGTLTLIDRLPPSDSLGAEPTSDGVSQLQPANVKLEATMEVLTTEGMDVKDVDVEDELQQVSTDNSDVAYVMPPAEAVIEEEEEEENHPCSTPVELSSDIQVHDAKGQSLDDVILQIIKEDAGDSCIKDVERSSLHQLEAQLVQDEGLKVNHNILRQCAETDVLGSSFLLEQGANGSQLEVERTEGKVSSRVLVEASEETAILLATKGQVEREEIYLTGYILFLSSGAALLDHPFKELTGGDNAYFVTSSKWLGVANGVSQWSFEGTDPGVYAQELMRTCKEIVLNTATVPLTNPVELLCRGVKETNMSGSSNILIANFNGQALHVANIGDTGFIVIRHGAVYKKSSPLLHEFHFALQVEDRDDPLQLAEEYVIELEEGDIVVSATDGLFDNLYEQEIAMVVSKSLQAGMKPEEIAQVLATRAQEVGRSAFVRSPFSDAAQAAGYTGYSGGKPDNVAVIVSLVEKTC